MAYKYRLNYLLSFALILLMGSCWVEDEQGKKNQVVEGYQPVYGSAADYQEVKLTGPREIKNPGRIYVYGKFLLVNERNEGIHVFDNVDPLNPEPFGFVSILGNHDMAIRNNVLYADHLGNIVALEVVDFETLTQKGSLPIHNWNLGLPPPSGSYFECVDPSLGLVVQWKKVQITNPDCYATY